MKLNEKITMDGETLRDMIRESFIAGSVGDDPDNTAISLADIEADADEHADDFIARMVAN